MGKYIPNTWNFHPPSNGKNRSPLFHFCAVVYTPKEELRKTIWNRTKLNRKNFQLDFQKTGHSKNGVTVTTQLSSFEGKKGKRHLCLHSSFSDDYMWRSHLSLLFFLLLLRTPEYTSRRNSHRRWLFLHRRRLCFVAFVVATLVVVPSIIFIGKYNLWFLKFWHWKVENIFAKNVREMTLLKSVVRTRRHNYGGKWNLYNR